MASFQDVNNDGRLDLVVHVTTSAFQLTTSDTRATVKGKTFGGVSIKGTDTGTGRAVERVKTAWARAMFEDDSRGMALGHRKADRQLFESCLAPQLQIIERHKKLRVALTESILWE